MTDTLTAEFVAATRAYRPAMRWLRANGWSWRNGDFRHHETHLSLEWGTGPAIGSGDKPYITVNARSKFGQLLHCVLMTDVSTVQQAIDYLVTAGVLPGEFHSLASKPTARVGLLENHARNVETCSLAGHQMSFYSTVSNASICKCGEAWESGNFRLAAVTS